MTEATHTPMIRKCPECMVEFDARVGSRRPKVFCSQQHKADHANRRMVRGKALAAIAMGWRHKRGQGPLGSFLYSEMNQMLDLWNSEDHAAGRMNASEYAALVVDFNPTNPEWSLRYNDRKNHR